MPITISAVSMLLSSIFRLLHTTIPIPTSIACLSLLLSFPIHSETLVVAEFLIKLPKIEMHCLTESRVRPSLSSSMAGQPRTSLGWELDLVVGYFVFTQLVCFAWPRPRVVGPVLMVFTMALLQGLTPDRVPIFGLHYMGQQGYWRRHPLLNSLYEQK